MDKMSRTEEVEAVIRRRTHNSQLPSMGVIQPMWSVSVRVSLTTGPVPQTLLSYETCSLVVSSSIKEFPLKYLERMR